MHTVCRSLKLGAVLFYSGPLVTNKDKVNELCDDDFPIIGMLDSRLLPRIVGHDATSPHIPEYAQQAG